jgi:SAM-dependent methyltransferase
MYTENQGEYLKNNPTWHVEDSSWKAQHIKTIINKNQLNPKSIVDVGCGGGEVLNQLYLSMPNDVRFFGCDISPDAINFAKNREKDRLHYKVENFLLTKKVFDLLLLIDVFEHVENYYEFLKKLKAKSRYFVFHIPLDISILGILRNKLILSRKSVGHLHHFMKDTALATLMDTGYEIIDYFYTSGSLDLPRKTFKSKLAVIPRKILYMINKDIAAMYLGGMSIMVLAK